MKNKKRIIFLLFSYILTAFITIPAFAQNTNADKPYTESAAFYIAGFLLFGLAVLFAVIMVFDIKEREPVTEKPLKEKRKKVVFEEAELLLDHNYDDIRELDNKIPRWFQILFLITVVFAIAYMVNYHLLGKSNLMIDEYADEMLTAQQQKEELIKSGALINESSVTLLTAPDELQKGKEIFSANCIPCHGTNAEGTVGPNLTDDYWIHGGGIKNVFRTISQGVPDKGMITWANTLNPKQIQQVASYVLSLHGTNPPNAKPQEGSIWVDSTAGKTKSDSASSKTKSKTDTTLTNKKINIDSTSQKPDLIKNRKFRKNKLR